MILSDYRPISVKSWKEYATRMISTVGIDFDLANTLNSDLQDGLATKLIVNGYQPDEAKEWKLWNNKSLILGIETICKRYYRGEANKKFLKLMEDSLLPKCRAVSRGDPMTWDRFYTELRTHMKAYDLLPNDHKNTPSLKALFKRLAEIYSLGSVHLQAVLDRDQVHAIHSDETLEFDENYIVKLSELEDNFRALQDTVTGMGYTLIAVNNKEDGEISDIDSYRHGGDKKSSKKKKRKFSQSDTEGGGKTGQSVKKKSTLCNGCGWPITEQFTHNPCKLSDHAFFNHDKDTPWLQSEIGLKLRKLNAGLFQLPKNLRLSHDGKRLDKIDEQRHDKSKSKAKYANNRNKSGIVLNALSPRLEDNFLIPGVVRAGHHIYPLTDILIDTGTRGNFISEGLAEMLVAAGVQRFGDSSLISTAFQQDSHNSLGRIKSVVLTLKKDCSNERFSIEFSARIIKMNYDIVIGRYGIKEHNLVAQLPSQFFNSSEACGCQSGLLGIGGARHSCGA